MQDELNIRLADPDLDAEAIASIYRLAVEASAASFEEAAPDAAEMAGRMRTTLARTPWLVAVAGGAVVGYAYAGAHHKRAGYRWSVDVSACPGPGARGGGRHRRGRGPRAAAERPRDDLASPGFAAEI